MTACPACGGALIEMLRPWCFACRKCSYEGSTLQPHILQQPEGALDEAAREIALEALRKKNFQRLMQWIRELASPGHELSEKPRLLDVGCAHGWFLEQCATNFSVLGIEPDVSIARATAKRGLDVREGFFPEALEPDERFEIVVFNDVLEHIPDVHSTIAACSDRLVRGGLLVVNAPSRRGALYRLSKLLARIGRGASFDRMWQMGFPSPHVHYFDTESINRVVAAHGFKMVSRRSLPAVSLSGLYSRIRYSNEVSWLQSIVLTAGVVALTPFLYVLQPDIEVWFFERSPG